MGNISLHKRLIVRQNKNEEICNPVFLTHLSSDTISFRQLLSVSKKEKNQTVVKDAGVLMSRCSGPQWLIRQFVDREKPYRMMQFHVTFAAGEAVKMSLEDGQGAENGHFYMLYAEYLMFERRF